MKRILRHINRLLIITIFIVTTHLIAQQKKDTIVRKSFFKKIWGAPLKSGITFMPVGTHTIEPNVFDVWYGSYNYRNLELSVFKNSFSDWTLGLFYKRGYYFSEKFHIAYGGGIVYGYKGKLQTVDYIPFRDSFLFTGAISPIVGLDIDYKISKKVSIRSSISPLIIIYGFRYYL